MAKLVPRPCVRAPGRGALSEERSTQGLLLSLPLINSPVKVQVLVSSITEAGMPGTQVTSSGGYLLVLYRPGP